MQPIPPIRDATGVETPLSRVALNADACRARCAVLLVAGRGLSGALRVAEGAAATGQSALKPAIAVARRRAEADAEARRAATESIMTTAHSAAAVACAEAAQADRDLASDAAIQPPDASQWTGGIARLRDSLTVADASRTAAAARAAEAHVACLSAVEALRAVVDAAVRA